MDVSAFVPGNQITLLHNGKAFFPAIVAAFDRARYEIFLESYIYRNDATGQRIARSLERAASRGVRVHVLLDGYGSKDLPRHVLERLRKHGVKTLVYRPNISPWTFRRKRLRRMHRKIVVVDREIAFVGGINIADDREVGGEMAARHDYAVSVEGPLVDVIRHSVQRLWSMSSWLSFRKGAGPAAALPVSNAAGRTMSAAFLTRDNFHHRRDIEQAYMRAIEHARSEIVLAHAYFMPGLEFRHALRNAARRGVSVVLLLQGRVEYFLEHHASRALYGSFLEAGIRIYEYGGGFLHAKVAVIDGYWATVGSSNIDPFSLLLSREANVVVVDETFGATLAQHLHQTVEIHGRPIVAGDLEQRGIGLRLVSWFCYGLLRLAIGISGYERDGERAGRA